MEEDLETRIDALERTITDGDGDFDELRSAAETGAQLDSLETDLGELQDRVYELEAATQALRGYVGNVRAVNTDVESTADAALAKAEAVEAALSAPGSAEGQRPDSREGSPSLEQRHTRASESHGGAEATEPARSDGTRVRGDGSSSGNGDAGPPTTEGDSARRTAGPAGADGRPTGTAVAADNAGHGDSTNPRCERCGRARGGEKGAESGGEGARNVGPRSPVDGTNEDGILGRADGAEPDLAGLSEGRTTPASDGTTTTGTDEPGTLDRIRQLL